MRKLAYQPGNSIIHRLYPVTKFAWLLLGTALLFVLSNGYLLFLTAIFFMLILISIAPKIFSIRGFRLILLTGTVLLLLYVIFDKGGAILFDPGVNFLRITNGGLLTGLLFSGRFLSIVFLSYLFILTTEPNQLAYALMKLGLPYRFGFMLVTALRLAPIMEDEGRTIYHAQLVRGIRYDQGGFKKILLMIQQFMTPLLISALRRADKLVFSMEGRGFGKYQTRTFRRTASPTRLDITISFALLIFFILMIVINYGGLI